MFFWFLFLVLTFLSNCFNLFVLLLFSFGYIVRCNFDYMSLNVVIFIICVFSLDFLRRLMVFWKKKKIKVFNLFDWFMLVWMCVWELCIFSNTFESLTYEICWCLRTIEINILMRFHLDVIGIQNYFYFILQKLNCYKLLYSNLVSKRGLNI